jgi:hypothetical protein
MRRDSPTKLYDGGAGIPDDGASPGDSRIVKPLLDQYRYVHLGSHKRIGIYERNQAACRRIVAQF